MKFSHRWWNRKFILHTFWCCGHKWELLLWRRDPGRHLWYPVCPTCGQDGSAWVLKQKWVEV